MSSFDSSSLFDDRNKGLNLDKLDLSQDEDLVMEQILENINNTPIGNVLKKIASLPEIRQDKVLGLRKQITKGDYDLNDRLDKALDRVLEDLIA
jgi:hypothetical protein